jgi:hypothetical protein
MSAWGGRGDDGEPMLPLFSRDNYPTAVVDHVHEARAFLERYKEYVARRV